MILSNTVTTKISDIVFGRIKSYRAWNNNSASPSQLDLRHSKSYPVMARELPRENAQCMFLNPCITGVELENL
jgi:hypothetical protein